MRQGDGRGGWIVKPAECQILRYRERGWSAGFGVAQMDNGEVVLLGICAPRKSLWYRWGECGAGDPEKTIIAFSRDRGNTWTDFEPIGSGRPMMLAYLGGGNLTYLGSLRHLSSDYGRTWSSVPRTGTIGGAEGNPLVDRDEHGMATRLTEIQFGFGPKGKPAGAPDFIPGMSFLHWSCDGARTWKNEFRPPNWSSSEGSLVRAQNGWLVAALRTGPPVDYFPGTGTDEYRSTSVSISRDDGRTWSDPHRLFDGRMHPNLLRMPTGDILMTVTVRHDIDRGERVSYRRGCEAVVSHDNGLTWDLGRTFILDEWEFYDDLDSPTGPGPGCGQTGHLCSTLLDDDSILTVHNNYLTMGMTLIRWRP